MRAPPCPTFCIQPHGLKPPGSCPWNFPGKIMGVVTISFSKIYEIFFVSCISVKLKEKNTLIFPNNWRVYCMCWPLQIPRLPKMTQRGQVRALTLKYKDFVSDITDTFTAALYLFSSVQSLSRVRLFATPWTAACQASSVHHQLPEFTQTHIYRVGDAIQPSHPLSSPSPPAPNPSQHQGLFQWVNSSHEVAKVLEFQL